MPVLDSTDLANVAIAVWDALASDHRVAGSMGSFLGALILDTGTLPGTGVSGSTAQLRAGPGYAFWTSSLTPYAPGVNRLSFWILDGTGRGQIVGITGVSSSGLMTIDNSWTTTPDNTSVYAIVVSDKYRYMDWARTANPTSAAPNVSAVSLGTTAKTDVANAVWDALRSAHTTANTFGERVLADVQKWVGSTPNALSGGRVDVAVGAVANGAIAAAAFAANALGAVWDELAASHTTNSTLGKLMGFLDAAVSSRAAPSDLPSVPTANQNADALLDRANAVDGSTPRSVLKWLGAAVLGKGAGTAAKPFRAIDDSADRVAATFDPDGARATVTKS